MRSDDARQMVYQDLPIDSSHVLGANGFEQLSQLKTHMKITKRERIDGVCNS